MLPSGITKFGKSSLTFINAVERVKCDTSSSQVVNNHIYTVFYAIKSKKAAQSKSKLQNNITALPKKDKVEIKTIEIDYKIVRNSYTTHIIQ